MKNEFLDEVKIQVTGGIGGSGCIAFARAKYIPMGGPSGGDGGNGGSIWLEARSSLYTLNEFLFKVHFKGERGQHGLGDNKAGKRGDDMTIGVPLGTQVYTDKGKLLADLTQDGERFLAARGGMGGRGNAFFASGQYKAPKFGELGEVGQERWLKLVLKMVADVGLVGFPNAGKSTLLAAVSKATPKIAPYPFTTLSPNLGVVTLGNGFRFVVADIPGLIEGAHEGVGLGHKFLRHVERNRILLHLVDLSTAPEDDLLHAYKALRHELEMYNPELLERPHLVAFTKIDLPEVQERLPKVHLDVRSVPISGLTGEGIPELLDALAETLETVPRDAFKVEVPQEPKPPAFTVKRRREGFYRVSGPEVERLVQMTEMDNDEAVRHLQLRFKKIGLEDELKRQGAQAGDTVAIKDFEFEFSDQDVLPQAGRRKKSAK